MDASRAPFSLGAVPNHWHRFNPRLDRAFLALPGD